MCSTPLVVTHPCALVRDALRCILTRSPVSAGAHPTHTRRRRGKLSGLSRHLHLASRGPANALQPQTTWCDGWLRQTLRLDLSSLPSLTLQRTSCSHWRQASLASCSQNIPSKQLIKSLELVALGQTVIHPQFHLAAFAQMAVQSHPTREFEATSRPQETVVTAQSLSSLGTQKCNPLLPSWPCRRPRREELRMGARLATSLGACRAAASW